MSARDIRAKVDLRVYENATFQQQFQWKVNNVPVDITGYTGEMQIRAKITDDTPLLTLTTAGGGIIISDPTNGIFVINIADEVSANVCADHVDIKGVYDLRLLAPNQPTGQATMLLYGECLLVAAVTRGVL